MLTTCAYGVLIKEPLLSDYEMLNVHPSLLPRWRGAAPIERAIMAGDEETGVTIMRVTAGWDSGPIYLAAHGADPPRRRLRHARARGSSSSARGCSSRRSTSTRHRSSRTSRSSPTRTRSARASGRWTRRSHPSVVERTIRALRPHIGSRLPLPDGTFLGVIAAEVDGPTRAPAGGLVRTEGDRLLLDCHGGALELTEVRPPGGRPMAASDWLRGRPDQGLVELPLRPGAARPRPRPRCSPPRAIEWEDDNDEWQPHVCALAARGSREVLDAMVELGSDAEPAMRELGRVRARAARPGRTGAAGRGGGGAARDGRARAGRDACSRRSRARSATSARRTARTGCSSSAPTPTTASARRSRSRSAAVPARTTLAALIALSADPEAAVRDWATFALGTLAEQDSPALRDALAARLDDPDEDTRLEAIHGLALRGDDRARPSPAT